MTAMKTRRQGATLFEIIVVLAILVVVSALSVPSFQAMYGSYKLNAAVDSVRAAWADARARAIEEGRPYRFAVEPNGSSFRVAPDHPDYWTGSGPPSNDPNGQGLILAQSLPSGVRFTINGEGSGELPNDVPNDVLAEKPVTTSNWSTAVIFQTDGTAREDVKVLFRVRGCKPTCLQLRGLTGDVSVQAEQ
jgi:Tfp pilus assembly protein FimT